jgi:hypothetical protein
VGSLFRPVGDCGEGGGNIEAQKDQGAGGGRVLGGQESATRISDVSGCSIGTGQQKRSAGLRRQVAGPLGSLEQRFRDAVSWARISQRERRFAVGGQSVLGA